LTVSDEFLVGHHLTTDHLVSLKCYTDRRWPDDIKDMDNNTHTHICLTALWTLSGITRVRRYCAYCFWDVSAFVPPFVLMGAEWRIVRQEMYSTRMWKVGDIVRFKIEVGFSRNVQKCNSWHTQNGCSAAWCSGVIMATIG